MEKQLTLTKIVYAMQAASFSVTALVAVVINYIIKKPEAEGTGLHRISAGRSELFGSVCFGA